LCGRQPAPERLRLDVIGTDALAVDLDHRDQLAVPGLELRIARDLDPIELEAELLAQRRELRLGALAQMAVGRPVERDSRDTALA
jgi:hypothetical protein